MKLIFYRIVQQRWNFSKPVWSFFSVNLFIKKAFMKSRDHFGTPMPLCMSVTQLKVSSTHLASTVGIPKIGILPKAGHLNVCFSNGNAIQKLDTGLVNSFFNHLWSGF